MSRLCHVFVEYVQLFFLAKPSQKVKNKTKLSFFMYAFDCFYYCFIIDKLAFIINSRNIKSKY